jgi:hypothetical protein
LYEMFPPRARERIKLLLNAHGHGQSRLDGMKARDHALGKKRLDRVAQALTAVMAQAGVTSLRGRDCLEFGAGYVPTEALVFYLLGASRSVATDYNAIARMDHLVTAARAADRSRVLSLLSPFADGVDVEQRLEGLLQGDADSARRLVLENIIYSAPHDMSAAPLMPPFDFIHSLSVFEHLPVPLAPRILEKLVQSSASGGTIVTEIDLRDHRDLDGAPLAFRMPGDDYDPQLDFDRRGNRLSCSAWLDMFATQPDIASRTLYRTIMDKRFAPPGLSSEETDDVLTSWLGLASMRMPAGTMSPP